MIKTPTSMSTTAVLIFKTDSFFSAGSPLWEGPEKADGELASLGEVILPFIVLRNEVPQRLQVVVEPARVRYPEQCHDLGVAERLFLREQL